MSNMTIAVGGEAATTPTKLGWSFINWGLGLFITGFAVKLCAYGLIAEIMTAAVGFFVGNQIWPNFYFEPVQMGKNLWLGAQGLNITVFLVGTCYAAAGVRRAAAQSR